MWKYVIQFENMGVGTSVERAVELARAAGYFMFAWNGEVYRVPKEGDKWDSQPLGLTTKRLDNYR